LGVIDRRTFFATFLPFVAPRVMVLEAIAAARMPETILVPGARIRGPVVELRKYRSPVPDQLFRRAGIHVVRRSKNSYLIGFQSLTERQRKWDALAADPEWRGMHPIEISLYRRIA